MIFASREFWWDFPPKKLTPKKGMFEWNVANVEICQFHGEEIYFPPKTSIFPTKKPTGKAETPWTSKRLKRGRRNSTSVGSIKPWILQFWILSSYRFSNGKVVFVGDHGKKKWWVKQKVYIYTICIYQHLQVGVPCMVLVSGCQFTIP